MPRFESSAGDQGSFWEIVVVGDATVTWRGVIGRDGVMSGPTRHGDPEAAGAEAARQIAAIRAEGYLPIDDGPGEHARNPELVDTILEASHADEAYLVYGDWLQAVGDPRGELVMLDHKRERKPLDAKLTRAHMAFRRKHWPRMLPPRLHELDVREECAVEWGCGFVRRVRLARDTAHPHYTPRELMVQLLEHPSGELLQELEVGLLGPGGAHRYQPVVDALCAFAPRSLRALSLVDSDVPEDELPGCDLGDLTPLLTAMPELERLQVRGSMFEIRTVDESRLRSLAVFAHAGEWSSLLAIAGARWPRLESLALHGDDDSAFPIALIGSLLRAESAPALRRLAITSAPNTAQIWAALRDAPLLSQLEVLDLSKGRLGDDDVDEVLARREPFAHLRELSLGKNCISRHKRTSLRELCETVVLDEQRGPGSDAPQFTREDVVEFAPDYRSIPAAREYVDRDRWELYALWGTVFWGTVRGSQPYDVFVDMSRVDAGPDLWESGCTCPSPKIPCKHALALLYLANRASIVPVKAPPQGFVERCRAARYDDW